MNLKMEGISKSFGSNLVLDKVSFEIEGGEIKALLGENGAGKSTLMNILGGVIDKNEGHVFLDGKEVVFSNPKDAMDSGIAFIHQELNLINDLAIYENLFIGREKKKNKCFLDHKSMQEEGAAVFERMGIDLDVRAMVRDLDASYKQIVEIMRAMMMNARLIIMDEPTTSLTDPEIERVFSFMRRLKSEGVAIIFISHKLNEVMSICDSYTVLRDGHMVANGSVKSVTTSEIASMMVGHAIDAKNRVKKSESKEEVLRVESVSDGRHFDNISFSLYKGEVLGFTGLLGDGRSELFLSLFGDGRAYKGKMFLNGKEKRMKNTSQAVDEGIAYVPRNRKENGIIKDLSILENGSLVTLSRNRKFHLFIDKEKTEKDFEEQKKNLRIKMERNEDLITSLSGGNQQKVVLAKWLSSSPHVLVLDNPTQGVDVGAKEDIYEIIAELAEKGVSVIVLSSEAQEIMRVCSRCFVLYHGKMMGELEGDQINENTIMKLATGVEE